MIKIINRKKNRRNVDVSRTKVRSSGNWAYRLMALFFVATVVFALFFSDFLTIESVRISGLDRLTEAPIREIVDKKMEGKYLSLVKKNNLILFPARSLRKELAENFRWIEDVKVQKKFPAEIELVIKERKFGMIFCSRDRCYLLNENGEAYAVENFTAQELEKENLVTLTDLSEVRIEGNPKPLETEFREFILQLERRVWEETGIILEKRYETPNRMSGDLKVETQAGWRIYFSASVGIEKEMSVLKAILEHKIEKERQKDLEYIDLRIANKVFYKFKEGTEQMNEAKTVSAPEKVEDTKKSEKKKKD